MLELNLAKSKVGEDSLNVRYAFAISLVFYNTLTLDPLLVSAHFLLPDSLDFNCPYSNGDTVDKTTVYKK